VRQRAEEFADGARRPAHALPDAAVVDRHPGEGKARLAELREVGRDQCPPLLSLAALRGEAGGHLAHVGQNRPGIHPCTLLSSLVPCRVHLTCNNDSGVRTDRTYFRPSTTGGPTRSESPSQATLISPFSYVPR
jgi:hypothetical protein